MNEHMPRASRVPHPGVHAARRRVRALCFIEKKNFFFVAEWGRVPNAVLWGNPNNFTVQ